jgi:hypothetical protein
MAALVVYSLIALMVTIGIEYLSKGVPSPWREVILITLCVGLLVWLFSILSM